MTITGIEVKTKIFLIHIIAHFDAPNLSQNNGILFKTIARNNKIRLSDNGDGDFTRILHTSSLIKIKSKYAFLRRFHAYLNGHGSDKSKV